MGHYSLEDARRLLPVAELDVTAHDPVVSNSTSLFDILAETEALRVLEGGKGHYVGLVSGDVWACCPSAYTPGRSSASGVGSYVIAHELGHNMGLWHAPCGGAEGVDPSFPDPRGRIAAWGYDARSGDLVPSHWRDVMSYCDPYWISGYHFSRALVHRLHDEGASAAAPAAASVRSLLLWGGVDTTGTPFLNPAFVADSPPALPDSAGDHTVTGRDASGQEFFSLSFAMPRVADGDRTSSFAFVLPAQPGWAEALASVTLAGPDGIFTLDRDSDIPMAVLRDPRSGQVRGFLRDLPPPTQAVMDAGGRTAGPDLEVLFSRGIPDAAAWRK